MTRLTAHAFPGLYDNLGVDTDNLGFIMLKVSPFPVVEFVEDGDSDLFYHPDEDSYARGAPAEEKAHVTLLGGLLKPGLEWRKEVDQVLEGWVPPRLVVGGVGAFPSPTPEHEYTCIVAHIKVVPELLEGRQRLEMLPHISMFPGYQAHLTLAYVAKSAESKWVEALSPIFTGMEFEVTGLSYGGEK